MSRKIEAVKELDHGGATVWIPSSYNEKAFCNLCLQFSKLIPKCRKVGVVFSA